MDIIVDNLPRDYRSGDLEHLFEPYVSWVQFQIKIESSEDGTRRFAVGTALPDCGANVAVRCLNGRVLAGSALEIRPFTSYRAQRQRRSR